MIIDASNRSAVGTLVERMSGLVLLLHLPDGREAEKVNEAMKRAIAGLPQQLRRTITLGSGEGDGEPRPVHRRHRDPGVLL